MDALAERRPLRSWIRALQAVGLVKVEKERGSERGVTLRRPFEIQLANPHLGFLRAAYRRDVEIGGVLITVPRFGGTLPRLETAGIQVIPNVSASPERSYRPLQQMLDRVTRAALSGRLAGQRALPLFFHSHPAHRPDLRPELGHLKEYFNLDTSQPDRCSSLGDWRQGTHHINLPRVLVSGVDDRLFVGAYGGGVLPLDFDREMRKPIEEFHQQMRGLPVEPTDPWWFLALKGVAVIASAAVVVGSETIDGAKEYFGTTLREFVEPKSESRLYSMDNSEVLIRALAAEPPIPRDGAVMGCPEHANPGLRLAGATVLRS